MKTTKNRGSALLLVLIALLILSLIGLAALTQSGSEINTTGNFFRDKSAFFAADAGIQFGINEIDKNSSTPYLVKFAGTIDKNNYRTGFMTDTLKTAKNVKGFMGFEAPQPPGQSIGMESETGIRYKLWQLTVASESNAGKGNQIRKQLQTVVRTMVPAY